MKKSLSILFALVLLLTGCGGNAEPTATDSSQPAVQTEQPAPPTPSETATPNQSENSASDDSEIGVSQDVEFGTFTVIKKMKGIDKTISSGPFEVTVHAIQIGVAEPNETYKPMFDEKDKVSVVTIEMTVENKSDKTNSFYPDQGTIVTNTKTQASANIWFSDSVGGDFIGEVVKKGNVIFLIDDDPQNISLIKYVIGGPFDGDFNSIGEDITFELSF